jgi:thioredoxin 1
MVREINSAEELNKILNGDKPVIINFGAGWCGPCRMIAPKFEELSNTYTQVDFCKVDVDEVNSHPLVAAISAVPTFKAFKRGAIVSDFAGANGARIEQVARELV